MATSGPIARLSTFVKDVQAELLKCTWPTWPELRQSTVVVIISFLLLGLFVSVSDVILRALVQAIL
ncbi:MAG: preprotein translocase subunit SecE [Verrucomicrobia bacterium]|nr:preprotein translocase subunit SecE [Verrucomicrobiota bacterium]MCH8513456.1 preprotein translocase subunit SecE [Kiritimatiellia bacterium]